MTRESFIRIMEDFQKRFTANEQVINQIYSLIGTNIVDVIDACSYIDPFLDTLATAIVDNENYELARDDFNYLVFDSMFSLELFCDGTVIGEDERHPLICDFGEFYDFLKEQYCKEG